MAKTTILVTEDENIIARNLQRVLERLGYTVPAIASSGEEAIAQAGEIRPDLVLMDIVLKGEMDGIQAAEEIRDRYDIPVIFSTAYADDETLQRAKLTEPFGYILKPFTERELDTNIQIALFKHETEAQLRQSKEFFYALTENASDMVTILDREGTIRYASAAHQRLLGYDPDALIGRDVGELLHPDDLPVMMSRFADARAKESQIETTEIRVRDRAGAWHIVESVLHYRLGDPIVQGVVVNTRDVTARKQIEQEREELIEKLKGALAQVKALSGLLPICSVCKKIRDDSGYWNQLEIYIRDHSEAEFTHSICPDCARKLYPELYDE